MIAPFWWIHFDPAAYAAIKYANAVIMSLAAVPTYLLARMLVSRRGAVVVALGSVAVPGMAYATSIVPDVLAYPYFALCSWLAVRALRSKPPARRRARDRRPRRRLLRPPEAVHAPRSSPSRRGGRPLARPARAARELRRNWSRGDTVGAIALLLGALLLFNRVVLSTSTSGSSRASTTRTGWSTWASSRALALDRARRARR